MTIPTDQFGTKCHYHFSTSFHVLFERLIRNDLREAVKRQHLELTLFPTQNEENSEYRACYQQHSDRKGLCSQPHPNHTFPVITEQLKSLKSFSISFISVHDPFPQSTTNPFCSSLSKLFTHDIIVLLYDLFSSPPFPTPTSATINASSSSLSAACSCVTVSISRSFHCPISLSALQKEHARTQAS